VIARIDWGTAPDWIAAVGTVGALAAAVIVFAVELKHRREERKDAEKDQARLVAAWLDGPQIDTVPNPLGDIRFPIRVVNRSNLPVSSCLVRLEWEGKPGSSNTFVWTLGPGHDRQHICNVQWDEAATHSFPVVSLGFVDAAGRVWRQYGGGKLEAGGWPD
jgi:hypothetical protein